MAEKRTKIESPKPIPRQRVKDGENDMPVEETSPVSNHPDCPVCLQPSMHPVRIPCGHIFCFLCVKGASNQNRRCALCRQDIPPTFFENPTLLDKTAPPIEKERYAWFYEGRNGWWQYDERTDREIEDGYRNKKRSFELLIAGYMYIIDLDHMSQMRRSDPSRRRRIKRDLISAPKKGIAGLKFATEEGAEESQEVATGTSTEQAGHKPAETSSSSALERSAGPADDSNRTRVHEEAVLSANVSLTPGLPTDQLNEELQSLSLSGAQDIQEVLRDSEEPQREASDSDEAIEV